MKKLNYLLMILLIGSAVASCDNQVIDDFENVNLKDAYVLNDNSRPISYNGITPVTLAVDKPKGGNVTCSDVAQAFETTFSKCGTKLNYGDFDKDGDFEFDGTFEGVSVTVTDGTYVEFNVTNTPGTCYKVGAVIVKGGNTANVYFYPDGEIKDSKLAAPINSSGSPSGLSNLTFCFIECQEEMPDLIIVLKSYLQTPWGPNWAGTSGIGSDINSLLLGYVKYTFNATNTFPLYMAAIPEERYNVGTLKAVDYIDSNDGKRYLEVEISCISGYVFEHTWLYVGSAEGYEEYLTNVDGVIYTDYISFPFQQEEKLTVKVFKIPID